LKYDYEYRSTALKEKISEEKIQVNNILGGFNIRHTNTNEWLTGYCTLFNSAQAHIRVLYVKNKTNAKHNFTHYFVF
jgi:NH3-dependent NAD+ synthetase